LPVKVVIFDFDGTIADSFDAALRIANGLAPEFNYRVVKPEEIAALRHYSYRKLAEHIGVAWHRIPRIAARVRRELESRFGELQPFAGLSEVLHELRHRGFGLGILTSNSRANVEKFLTIHRLGSFDFIATSASLWGKERRLKSLLKKQGLTAAEIIYVGDEVRDIEASRALAVRSVAVGWGYAAKEQLALHLPDHLIDRPEELLEILGVRAHS
jgi:phosphoglycolate phosphatase